MPVRANNIDPRFFGGIDQHLQAATLGQSCSERGSFFMELAAPRNVRALALRVAVENAVPSEEQKQCCGEGTRALTNRSKIGFG
jgi:hypothetical protein